ncbi:MAG TPA: branched-chain amino acid ABC transporter permease [Firmicutes bacterium]|jgi:branched-chain amino acid transport system permease protein|nr:branched-chain amino acid ABC transporter permease [Bacillota bacterium]
MEFLQQLINGLQLGSIYALIALGYTMVYGIVKLINFAHGDIYMIGAYIGFFAVGFMGPQFIPALILAMVGCAILGFIIERFAYRPLRGKPRIAALTTALGVSLLLENLVRKFIGPNYIAYPTLVKSTTIYIGGLQISNIKLIVLSVALIMMFGLQFIVLKTRTGKAMRAASQDLDAARLMGIDVNAVISYTFMIGSALAATAGILVGVAYPRIDPYMGILPGLKAFVAAVLGGIGSIPGAMVGGLVMGTAETMVLGFGKSTFRDAIAFTILIIVLLVKPTGIMGSKVNEKV